MAVYTEYININGLHWNPSALIENWVWIGCNQLNVINRTPQIKLAAWEHKCQWKFNKWLSCGADNMKKKKTKCFIFSTLLL